LEQDSPFLQERTNEMSYAQSAQPAQVVAGPARRGEGPKSGLVVSNELRQKKRESLQSDPGREHEQDPVQRLAVVDPSPARLAVAPRFSRLE
jgi:hypothetical protein